MSEALGVGDPKQGVTQRQNGTAQVVLITLAILALVLVVVLMLPFASALLLAAVLAAALTPWCDRLQSRLWRRRALAAAVLTIGAALLLVLPAALLTVMLGREIVDGITYVRNTLASEGVRGLVQDLPASLQALGQKLFESVPKAADQLQQLAGAQGGRAAAAVGGAIVATSNILLQLAMMLVALYFLLVDGRQLIEWVADVSPLHKRQTFELLGDFRGVSVAVLVSSVLTAGVQSLVALAGYLIAGVPQPLFFTLVTFFLAFVPAVGAGSAVLALSLLSFATGHSGQALFLVFWGLIPVGLSDNIVKPMLMKGRMEIHGAVILFALLGGIAVFGAVGLLAGPLILAFFLSIVRMCRRDLTQDA